jgi:hypothetical protein
MASGMAHLGISGRKRRREWRTLAFPDGNGIGNGALWHFWAETAAGMAHFGISGEERPWESFPLAQTSQNAGGRSGGWPGLRTAPVGANSFHKGVAILVFLSE